MLGEVRAVVHWFKRPDSGYMSGHLYIDGSCLHPATPMLRRAGWAVVMVDDEGRLLAAAYGAVPWEAAPEQLSRDAEDFAASMLPCVAMEPFECYADCAGTIGAAASGSVVAASASQARAHRWGRFFAAFPDIVLHKVKAHCSFADVQAGRISKRAYLGNSHADSYAKAGRGCMDSLATTPLSTGFSNL